MASAVSHPMLESILKQRDDSSTQYHPGELYVQSRAGTRSSSAEMEGFVQARLRPGVERLVEAVPHVFVSSTDPKGGVWSSCLFGAPGFARALGPALIQLTPALGIPTSDPLLTNIQQRDAAVGMIFIDFPSRSRYRVNGRVTKLLRANNASSAEIIGFQVSVKEAFGNCPKYIQARALQPRTTTKSNPTASADASTENAPDIHSDGKKSGKEDQGSQPGESVGASSVKPGMPLPDAHKRWITSADTFFLASSNPSRGADISHRGGSPGFVRVGRSPPTDVLERVKQPESGKKSTGVWLCWGDYFGNGMFQSLGNIASYPHIGLLFPDFQEVGHYLQVGGAAVVEFDPPQLLDQAERTIWLRMDSVNEVKVQSSSSKFASLAYTLVDMSPYNPALRDGTTSTDEKQAVSLTSSPSMFPSAIHFVQARQVTQDVSAMTFKTAQSLDYLPGQYGIFRFSVSDNDDGDSLKGTCLSASSSSSCSSQPASRSQSHIRHYTITSLALPPEHPNSKLLEVTVKRHEGGAVSRFLHDGISHGVRVELLGIEGSFTPFALVPSKGSSPSVASASITSASAVSAPVASVTFSPSTVSSSVPPSFSSALSAPSASMSDSVPPSPALRALFVSAGVGFTPIVTQLRCLLDPKFTPASHRPALASSSTGLEVVWLHSCRLTEDIPFESIHDLFALARQKPADIASFRLVLFITAADGETAPTVLQFSRSVRDPRASNKTALITLLPRRMDQEQLTRESAASPTNFSKDVAGTHAFVCGPETFMQSVLQWLHDTGLASDNVHSESFAF